MVIRMTNGHMTTFDRRQAILRLLQEQSSVQVTELAERLQVSEGTIRNDLTALEEEQLVMRVRGGAVLKNGIHSPLGIPHTRVNSDAKLRIARWAAELIEDGDVILLDASTTVLSMGRFLSDRRNLTVMTNGVEVGRVLAQNPTNTVMLIGGVLKPDGNTINGLTGVNMLKDLYIKTAFVSCGGFSLETGLTERDLQQAQLKTQLVSAARRIVALVDSSKFGKVSLAPFASIDQISQVVTDDSIDPSFIQQIRQAGIALTLCGEDWVDSFTPHESEQKTYTLGFANLSEDLLFAVDVRRGLERAAQQANNIDLVLADNQLSGEVALNIADHLVIRHVDLAIEFQIDEKVGNIIINKFHRAGIPVVAVDIPMVGATYFGVDNYRAGYMAGTGLGEWIQEHWNNEVDYLLALEEPRSGGLVASRIQGQIDGVQHIVGDSILHNILYFDSGNTTEVSEAQMMTTLANLQDAKHIAIICFNDDAAIGALNAARRLNRENDVVIVGQGADRRLREELRKPNSRIIGSTAFMPEKYGEKLIELAQKILRGEPTPPAVYMEHVFIDAANLDFYYPEG
jgi:ribose transport system substrate-binding protein